MQLLLRGSALRASRSAVVALSLVAALLVVFLFASPSPLAAQDLVWTRQFGTFAEEQGRDAAVDGDGDVYVAGYTNGTLPGQTMAGSTDAFVRKYSSSGSELWTRQFGTSAIDQAEGVTVDGGGNVYVTGFTTGTLPGQTLVGNYDAYLRKYDSAGNVLWTRQFGTSALDQAERVAVDVDGNSYVVGVTYGTLPGQSLAGSDDAFIRKYDSAGNELWTRQFGTLVGDDGHGVAVDSTGNAYMVGHSAGTLPGQTAAGSDDAFVRKYSSSGSELWTRQFGTSGLDDAYGVAIDSGGNAYMVGFTSGTLLGQISAGSNDAYVRKYDSAGNELWTRQFGTSVVEDGHDVAIDSGGNAYLAGHTAGALPGQTAAGDDDPYVRKYDSSGSAVWTRQFGTINADHAYGVAVDTGGNAYAVGFTNGTLLGQTSAGLSDAYLAMIGPDADGDGVPDSTDNCLTTANASQVDADGDTWGDLCDNCPSWSNASQALPPWNVPVSDPDCDGFTSAAETSMTTDPGDACGFTVGAPAQSETWPPDLVESNTINISDVLALKPVFNTAVPPTSARLDVVPGGGINISDVLALKPFFNKSCVP